MRELADQRRRNARRLLCIFQRVGVDAGAIRVEAGRRARDKFAIVQSRRNNLTPDRIRERNVRADVDPEPFVGPLRAGRSTRVDDVEFRAVANTAQDVMKEDRVRLARIRPPEYDYVGPLELLIRARAAARSENRRQTDDARRVSSAVAAVDVVAADHAARELLSDIVHFVRRLRAAEHSERPRAAAIACLAQCRCRTIECVVP